MDDQLASAFAAAGITPDWAARKPVQSDQVYLWPDNLEAWGLWCDLQTQWRHGFSGPTGLDYGAVLALIKHRRPSGPREVFDILCATERAYLDELAEQRKK